MKCGDFIQYRNRSRFFGVMVGIILSKSHNIVQEVSDYQFFNVLLENGKIKLISDHYLERVC